MISPALILVASLIGSPHCAAMCGGFAAVACSSSTPRTGQILYNFGRLIAYVALGAIAGLIGGSLNLGWAAYGVHQIASLVAGVLLIIWGIGTLFITLRTNPTAALSARISRFFSRLSTRQNSLRTPLLLGISSAFLPCGWLYTYVTVAGGTGSVLNGIAVMAVFWFGTLPILITIGGLSRFVSSPLKKFAPTITALLIIAAGFFSLYVHVNALPENPSVQASCH